MNAPRNVLVLGGRGDIGTAITDIFREKGDKAVATGRSELDLASNASIDSFFATNGNAFDVFVHCAGLNNPKLFAELTTEEIDESLRVNLQGFLRALKHVEPHLRVNGGYLLVISSIYGFISRRGRLPYSASKHALVGVVKALAIELGAHGVLVNALSPGFIMTKLTTKNNSPETIEKLRSSIPLGRLGAPRDIAEIAYFLCSPANAYINGADIVADGGYTIGGFQT